ncbi:Dihydropteroate synthase, DHPS domain protein, partial [mine drainage metagenome]
MMAYRQITQPTVMGVVNVTPDSFSEGGRFSTSTGIDHHACIEQAMEFCRQGADIIDVGGEASSFHRPGVVPVPADQQIHRVVPVINGLRKRMNESADRIGNT